MAGDWIKMRSDIYRDPRVCMIADSLMQPDGELAKFVNQNMQRDMTVTRNVMRNVTVGALVSVWGVMRVRGKRRNDDLEYANASIDVLDDVADIPGFGAAMRDAGWVECGNNGLIFRNFFNEYNTDPADVAKAKAAERQRKFREAHRDVTRNVPVTPREEKRREEKNKDQKHLSVSAMPKADVPAEAILAAFRELLPGFPQPRKLDGDRKKKIIARWHEDPERQTLDWWRDYFGYVAKSDFLTGRTGWGGCGFDWLIAPTNMRKVIEGNYENRGDA